MLFASSAKARLNGLFSEISTPSLRGQLRLFNRQLPKSGIAIISGLIGMCVHRVT